MANDDDLHIQSPVSTNHSEPRHNACDVLSCEPQLTFLFVDVYIADHIPSHRLHTRIGWGLYLAWPKECLLEEEHAPRDCQLYRIGFE